MAQLMPLPLTVSCSSKIQIGFTFLALADLGSPRQMAVKRVSVCVVWVQLFESPAVSAFQHLKLRTFSFWLS